MTQDEIIQMAEKAGFAIQELGDKTCHVVVYNFQDSETDVTKELECFADLVAAHEREACAKVCEKRSHRNDDMGAICAAAIRARGQDGTD